MSMQTTLILLLMPMTILASDGLSMGRPGNEGTYGSPDLEVPWSRRLYSSERDQKEGRDPLLPEPRDLPDTAILFQKLDDLERMENKPDPGKIPSPGRSNHYSQSESLPVEPEAHIPRQGTGQEILQLMNTYERANANSASDPDFKQGKDWDGNPSAPQAKQVFSRRAEQRPTGSSKIKAKFFKTCATPTSRPDSMDTTRRSTSTTPASRSSIFCLPDPSPFRPVTPKSPAPPTTSSPPPPPTSKPTAGKGKPSKCSKKSKLLTPKTAKIVLDIILATKQHALSVLKTLNYLEMEVLSQSADECPLQDFVPKKMPRRLEKALKPAPWTHSQVFFFGIRPASYSESISDLAVAREEELKLQRRVWEEHKQQMRAMQPSRPRRLQMAPPAAVRLETVKEPQVPQEPLEPNKPFQLSPKEDPSGPGDTWSPTYMPKAEMKAIREEDTPAIALQTEVRNNDQKRKDVLF